jgi:hypothetical protein
MRYRLEFKQEGGRRPYEVMSIDPAKAMPLPITFNEIGVGDDIMAMIRTHLARFAGYAYMESLIKDGDVGIEIGVDYGDGAARLFETDLARLHMVDPWLVNEDDKWTDVNQAEMDERYQIVCDRFSDEPRARIYRDTADKFFSHMPDRFADWVYIDGDHRQEAVYNDLTNSLRVVKPGGYIFGDDLWLGGPRWHYEIKAALDQFLEENKGKAKMAWDGKSDPFIIKVTHG